MGRSGGASGFSLRMFLTGSIIGTVYRCQDCELITRLRD